MKEEIIKELYETFELRERAGLGGMKFKYVPSDAVIDRMNRLFKGNWSTKVITQEKMDDAVVVRVRVSAFDSETGVWFEHDGYGSSVIMRYTAGEKRGEIIDIGNAYKSAEAKAIKNACSRWGVGLYLEDNPYEDELPSNMPVHSIPSPAPVVDPMPRPEGIKPAIPNIPPAGDLSKDTSVPTAPTGLTPPPFPSAKTELKKESGPFTPPVRPEDSKPNDITQEMSAGAITDVQKVAVQGLLQLKGVEFHALAKDALGTDTVPKRIEDLTYQEAVTIIKYGNDINKK